MALSEVEPPHEYMASSKVEPPQAPLQGACGSTRPGRVPHGLPPHLFYWNYMCDQSEGFFEGLVRTMNTWPFPKLNLPRCPFRVPAAPRAQSECHMAFGHTFSMGTPCATSLRDCFEGLG